jgi:hypothetical protein
MTVRIQVGQLANRLADLAGKLGLSSELGEALHKAAGILAKAVPRGSIPQGAEVATAQRLDQQQRQNAANVAAMRMAQGGGGAPSTPRPPNMPGAPGVPGGGAGAMAA